MNLWNRLWKRASLGVVVAVLIVGLTGCSLDDVLAPFGNWEIPFEQGETTPTDMGVVDNPLTVPDEQIDKDYDLGLV
jgi:hypothetical protein